MTETTDLPTPVADLLARARAYVTHSHAKNTLDAYAADWKHFSAWCDDHKRRALPASPETILCYVVDLVDRYTVATIDRRLSSIGYYHNRRADCRRRSSGHPGNRAWHPPGCVARYQATRYAGCGDGHQY